MPNRPSRLLIALLAFVSLTAARPRAVSPGEPHPPLAGLPVDVYSAARPAEVTVRHVDLDLTVDFDSRTLRGTAALRIQNLADARTLTLDTEGLTIEAVTLDDGQPALWSFGATNAFGAPMTIGIQPSTRRVTIAYSTSPTASGLHWNTPAQTLGRNYPYLYTQNEPISARSWIPIQDTPAVRMTYDATIRTSPELLALMSAVNPTRRNETGVYRFSMPTPVPAYLISLAVARLEFRELGSRGGVYAEPELIDDAAWELQYLPEMIEVAEAIAGPYPFGRYDLLMMPPTYIVGGMEHPRLNFINPGIISGNRPAQPLPSTLIAHELAHSWAGNQTTLATWADVWLNEGITSYLEARIIEEMSGVRRADYGWFNARRSFADLAQNTRVPESTTMHRVTGPSVHPVGFFNSAAYVKGALFMRMLEDELSREALDDFLRRYFARFRFRWVDDAGFIESLRALALRGDGELEARLRLAEWIYEPGLPANVTAPASSALFDEVMQEVDRFRNGAPVPHPSHWTSVEYDLFISSLGTSADARMAELDAAYILSSRPTPPFGWLTHSARNRYAPGLVAVDRYLMRGGPNGGVVFLYRILAETEEGRAIGRQIFDRAKDRYLPSVRSQIELILGLRATDAERQAA